MEAGLSAGIPIPRSWRPTRLGAFFCRSGQWTIGIQDALVSCRSTKGSLEIPLMQPKKGTVYREQRVVLVEFFDPACETCREFHPYVKELLAAHPGKVRLVLRYAPFHQGSDTMVLILEAAGRRGRFWETLEVMYATQPQWASHIARAAPSCRAALR